MKKPTKKVKRIKEMKGWAVYDKEGGLICAYADKEMANFDVKEGERYHLYNRNVIPCTISYSLPLTFRP